MAISKVQFKSSPEATPAVWMDTTDKTAAAGNMLSGTTALKNDGTTATGNIATKTSANMTASGATVTAPAGYYASDASKSVDTMTLPTGTTGSAASGYASKATVSRSTSDQYINIPTGYNSAGAYYKVSAVPNGTVTAPSSISGTSASVSAGTNTLTLSKTISVTPNVTTAGYISSGTAGNSSVSLTASVNTRSSSDLSVSGATITAPAGYYAEDASESVNTMTLPTTTAASATSGYASKATVSRSTSDQYINIPPGYNSAGGYYKVSKVANGSVTAPSTISGSSASVSAGTNTITLSKTVSVTPNVTTAGYISSGTAGNSAVSLTASVNTRGSSDLSASGATVTAPAGYYAESASKSVDSMTLPTGTTGSAASGYTSKATVSRSTSDQYINIPTGYNSAGAYYKINAVANGTEGTPTATKGTVSNHSVTVTPSVTNTAGYISGGTHTGTGVTVSVSELESGTKEIVSNGTGISVSGYSTVDVAVPSDAPNLQEKTDIDPTESSQTIEPDEGYGGLSSVQINAIDSNYVGSGVARKSSTDLTASGATVTAPAGYYASSASKSVDAMTLPTGTTGSAASGYTSKATVGRSTSDQYINIPTGYNSAGAYYKISKVANGSVTAPASISGTSATVSTGTNTLTLTKTVSVTPNVTTAGYISSGTAGNSSVSLTASVNTRNSDSLSASGATVTAPAGYYAEAASKTVASGTEGTPTATKGTVSDHSVTVTPSVTNTAGYISGGTHTGTGVTVTVAELESGTKEITSNGEGIDVSGYSEVDVLVTPSLQAKTGVSPSTSSQTIEPDDGYDGLSSVQIDGMPEMTLPTSTTSSPTSGYTSIGTFGRSTSDRYINIPTGYNATGAYYKLSKVQNGSVTAPDIITGTSASVSTGTNTLTLSKVVNVTPNVTAEGYITSGKTGPSSVSLTASVNIRSGASLSASGATVTAPAGYYPSDVSKTVSSGSVTAPSTISGSSATISAGTTTLTFTKTILVTPSVTQAGYISSGTAGNSSVSLTANIIPRYNSDLTVAGPTVTVPAGYYSTNQAQSVNTMTLPTSADSSATSGYTSKATINRSTSDQYINIPPGYNNSGGYYKVKAVPNGTAVVYTPLSYSNATMTASSGKITLSKVVSLSPLITQAGYISAGTPQNVTITLDASLGELYPVGSLWATESSTLTPAAVLGFGTWTQVSPIEATWNRLKQTTTWAEMAMDAPTIYVYKRTA